MLKHTTNSVRNILNEGHLTEVSAKEKNTYGKNEVKQSLWVRYMQVGASETKDGI